MTIRSLGPGDEEIVIELGAETPLTHAHSAELLSDGRTVYLVAFDDREPIGYVLAHELLRRHGDPSQLFVYELEVVEPARRRGVAPALTSNDPAMSFYRSLGGPRPSEDDAVWEFDYPA